MLILKDGTIIENPAKALDDIAEQNAENKLRANEIKDLLRADAGGRLKLFDYNWNKTIMVEAQRKPSINLVRDAVDYALDVALSRKISRQMFNKCYLAGKKPDQYVKLLNV